MSKVEIEERWPMKLIEKRAEENYPRNESNENAVVNYEHHAFKRGWRAAVEEMVNKWNKTGLTIEEIKRFGEQEVTE